jgi:putative ABC transport system permease protein
MRWHHAARALACALFRRPTLDAQLERDLAFHLEEETAENIKRGLSPEQASRAARIALGSVEHAKEDCRDLRRIPVIETFVRDLRYAVRTLRKSPVFAVTATATLALGVGANTAVFSMLQAAVWSPVPYPEPQRLVSLPCTLTIPGRPPSRFGWSYPKLEDLRRLTSAFESLEAMYRWDMNLTGRGDAERVNGEIVTGGYFGMLGVRASRGRVLRPDDDRPQAEAVAVLSDAIWRTTFASDDAIVGRAIELTGRPFTVVGIAPAGFLGESGAAQVWIAVAHSPSLMGTPERLRQRMRHWLTAIARLRPGVSVAQADQDVKNAVRVMESAAPSGEDRSLIWSGSAVPLLEAKVDPQLRGSLVMLGWAVGFVLLITCFNLANILLGRSVVRRHEIAMRFALGASRIAIFRQLMTESLVLGVLGGGLGLGVAAAAMRGFAVLQPPAAAGLTPIVVPLNIASIEIGRPAAVIFTVLLSIAAGVVFGIVPAFHASRGDLVQNVSAESRTTTRRSPRSALLVAQIALAVTLLTGAALLLRSFARLLAVDAGFDGRNVVALRVDLPAARYDEHARRAFMDDVTQRLRSVPGVDAVSVANTVPLRGQNEMTTMTIDGVGRIGDVGIHMVGQEYFAALRLPLRSGRVLTERDQAGAPRVAVINETTARRFFPGQDPVGRRAILGLNGWGGPEDAEIVGVVGDARYQLLDMPPGVDVYLSYRQRVPTTSYLLVRANRPPGSILPELRQRVAARDPAVPVYDVTTMDRILAGASGRHRFSSLLLATFAGLALALAAAGVYGTLSCSVAARTREIGLRMALGAPRRALVLLVLGNIVGLSALGVALGLAGTLASARVLMELLYQIAPLDPIAMFVSSLLVSVTALVAGVVPVLRAIRIDPLLTLRHE